MPIPTISTNFVHICGSSITHIHQRYHGTEVDTTKNKFRSHSNQPVQYLFPPNSRECPANISARLRGLGGLLVKTGEGSLVGLEVRGVDVEPGNGALPLESQALLGREAAGHLSAGVGVATDAGGLGLGGGLASLPNLGGVGDVLLEHGSGVGNGGDGSSSEGGGSTEEGTAGVSLGVEGRGGDLVDLSGGKGGSRASKEGKESKLHFELYISCSWQLRREWNVPFEFRGFESDVMMTY